MDSQRLHTKDYHTNFNTEGYLSSYMFFEMIPSFDILLKEMISIFVQNKERLGHSHALEFGGGPALYSSFLLAQYVDSIHFTDYTPSNLKAVEQWISREEDAHDWSELFETILQEYKQQSGDRTAELSKWEERLRDALKKGGLLICGDVNAHNCPILDEKTNIDQYDIILSSLCLEDACLTQDVYKATVKRLYALLKHGGFILLTHGRNQSFYTVIDKCFFALPVNEQNARGSNGRSKFYRHSCQGCGKAT
ncbi:hypothetical protein I4U23_031551 [Adineta vaga]|nr:hypothetical protein I4U23_031551 [Adineta vaga]